MSQPALLDASSTVLVVIDMQDGFLKAMHEADRIVANAVKLVETAKVFSIPIVVALQNADRMGDVTGPIAEALPHQERLNKMTFSCLATPEFRHRIGEIGRFEALLCGIEAHSCVSQTALDLLSLGYGVHVARDAISSRTPENRTAAIERMRDAGCIITSTEMAIFELTRDAARPEFKRILPIVK